VALPLATPELFKDSMSRAEYLANPYYGRRLKRFPFHFGQPEEVRAAFHRAVLGEDADGAAQAAE
jgi:hypothetical protein